MASFRALLLAVSLLGAAALAGCFQVRENAQPVDDEVNNAGEAGGGSQTTGGGDEGACIQTTTGEPTTDEAANPCPRGQYPAGG